MDNTTVRIRFTPAKEVVDVEESEIVETLEETKEVKVKPRKKSKK